MCGLHVIDTCMNVVSDFKVILKDYAQSYTMVCNLSESVMNATLDSV